MLTRHLQTVSGPKNFERGKENTSLLPKFPLETLSRKNPCNTKNFSILFQNYENIIFDHFTAKQKFDFAPV